MFVVVGLEILLSQHLIRREAAKNDLFLKTHTQHVQRSVLIEFFMRLVVIDAIQNNNYRLHQKLPPNHELVNSDLLNYTFSHSMEREAQLSQFLLIN